MTPSEEELFRRIWRGVDRAKHLLSELELVAAKDHINGALIRCETLAKHAKLNGEPVEGVTE